MGGLRRIAKQYDGIVINGVRWRWDYAADLPVLEEDMPAGSERWKASERAKWAEIAKSAPPSAKTGKTTPP